MSDYVIQSPAADRHQVTWADGVSVVVEGSWKLAAEIAVGRCLVRDAVGAGDAARRAAVRVAEASREFETAVGRWLRDTASAFGAPRGPDGGVGSGGGA